MIRPVLRYPGSKARLAKRIVALMPPHDAYLEPFFGSGIVLLNKPRCGTETANDLDGRVVNFFRVLRDSPEALIEALTLTPYAQAEVVKEPSDDPVENARRFAACCWMSRESVIRERMHFRFDVNRLGLAGTWARLPDKVRVAAERLRGVQIASRDALDLIAAAEPGTLIYADPPYAALNLYPVAFEEHYRLLSALNAHRGPVLISGRSAPMYDTLLSRWERHPFETKKAKNVREEEVVWVKHAT